MRIPFSILASLVVYFVVGSSFPGVAGNIVEAVGR